MQKTTLHQAEQLAAMFSQLRSIPQVFKETFKVPLYHIFGPQRVHLLESSPPQNIFFGRHSTVIHKIWPVHLRCDLQSPGFFLCQPMRELYTCDLILLFYVQQFSQAVQMEMVTSFCMSTLCSPDITSISRTTTTLTFDLFVSLIPLLSQNEDFSFPKATHNLAAFNFTLSPTWTAKGCATKVYEVFQCF